VLVGVDVETVIDVAVTDSLIGLVCGRAVKTVVVDCNVDCGLVVSELMLVDVGTGIVVAAVPLTKLVFDSVVSSLV
jgi:hypothetical protein